MDERDFHDQFYDGDAERIFSSPLYRELLDIHVAFLRQVTPEIGAARILSIGCGDGRRELAMATFARQIVAFDVSGAAIESAKRRADAMGIANVQFHVADIEEVGQRFASQFEVVWCAGILHHLTDAQTAALLRTARSALVAGGQFVSMDPNARRAVNFFKPLLRRTYDRYHSPGERELQPGAVVDFLRAAGFEDVEIRFTDAFISPLAWVFPRLTAPVASLLARLDRLLVKLPVVREASSGFAAIARRSE